MNSSLKSHPSSLSLPEDVVLSVRNVSKKFCRNLKRSMLYGVRDLARNMLGVRPSTTQQLDNPTTGDGLRKDEFWALQDISFDLKRGESLGLIGSNGSGKTTLLRLLTGIFPPDSGHISVRGRIGALIALGAGFHPHFTARENIYLNGCILGMSRAEIANKFDDIIEFAELGAFVDAPVSTYSSGMTVRLGFAIATFVNPELLLVDEVLSVGDMQFQLKCQRRIGDYIFAGGTVVLVSHNMQAVKNVCDRVLWLERGRIIKDGDATTVIDAYEARSVKAAYETRTAQVSRGMEVPVMNYDPAVHIEKVEFLNTKRESCGVFEFGENISIRIHCVTSRLIIRPILTVGVINAAGGTIFESYSHHFTDCAEPIIGAFNGIVTLHDVRLQANVYSVTVTLSEGEILRKLEWHEKRYNFAIVNPPRWMNQSLLGIETEWKINSVKTGY